MGRIREASDEVFELADVVHSARMVVLCAMHALVDGKNLVSYPT